MPPSFAFGLRFTVFCSPSCWEEVRWKGSGKPECTLQLLRIKYCLLHSRLKDHERVTSFAGYYGLCPILAPCTNKDNDGDTPCFFSYMFSSPLTFQRSEHQNLRSRHWWANMVFFSVWFMKRQRTACPSKFSYIFVTLPTSSRGPMESRTTVQNLRVHQFGHCKPQVAWAEEEPGTGIFVHWDINHCSFPQRLCSHWWATDSVSVIPSMQRQELACPSKSLCWH